MTLGPADPNDPQALFEEARRQGPGAAPAARRAGFLAEARDPQLAREAFHLAIRLDPLDPSPRLALARMHAEAGEFNAARAEAQGVLAAAVDQGARARAAFMLGEIARATGDNMSARTAYETTLQIEDELLTLNRGDPTAARWYARARGRLAELDAAVGNADLASAGAAGALAMLYGCASQVGETQMLAADIADAEMRLAAFDLDAGDAAGARKRLAAAISRYEALAITEKSEPHWRAVLGDAWTLAAEADFMRGAAADARLAIDKALQVRLKLATERGETWALAGAWRVRAALLSALNDRAGAAESLGQARILAERLCEQSSGGEAHVRFLVHTLLDEADHALRHGEADASLAIADRARQLAEACAIQAPGDSGWRNEAAAAWDRLGEAARLKNAPASSLNAFERAVEFRRGALAGAAATLHARRAFAAALLKLGEAALEAGAAASARTAFHESVTLRMEMAQAAPHDPATAHMLAAALERFGLAAHACGDAAAARAAWEQELDLAERIFTEPAALDALRYCAIVEAHLANLEEADAPALRSSALARLDALARAGALGERETALRNQLWSARA